MISYCLYQLLKFYSNLVAEMDPFFVPVEAPVKQSVVSVSHEADDETVDVEF